MEGQSIFSSFVSREGIYINADPFFKEQKNQHGVLLNLEQQYRLKERLEYLVHMLLKKFWNFDNSEIRDMLDDYYKRIIFIDPDTRELYFMPLSDLNIGIYFRKDKTPKVIFYKMCGVAQITLDD